MRKTLYLLLQHICLALLLHSKNICYVDAFPGAAGHCDTGDLEGKFSPHGESGGGPLSNGSLRVRIDTTTLQSWVVTELNAFQTYTVTLDFTTSNAAFFFRGFLFRLSGKNGEDVEGTLYVGSDSNVQLKGGCDAGISAVTHTNNDDKVSISFNFEYTESTSAELLLEVTSLREKLGGNWFYTPYNLQIGSPTTEPPVPTPTCEDPSNKFEFKLVKPDGKTAWKNCQWATKWKCDRVDGLDKTCPVTCGTCNDDCSDSPFKFKFKKPDGSVKKKYCSWVEQNSEVRCKKKDMAKNCRKTCGLC